MKKLLVFLIISLSSLLFVNSAKAYEVSYTSESTGLSATANISDDLPYYYIADMTNNLVLYVSSSPFVANYYNNGKFATGQTIYIYRKTAANAWTQYDWNSVWMQNDTGDASGLSLNFSNYDSAVYIANTYIKVANHDIYYGDTDDIVFYNTEYQVPELVDKNSIELENTQLLSYDIYISDSDLRNFYFNFELNDNNDYETLDISKTDISGFKFYALINENNLKHWTLINDPNNFYIDYNDEDYINNNSGISFTGNVSIDFSTIQNVEQIKLSIELSNAINYEINYSDSIDNLNTEYDYNFLGSEYSYIKNNYNTNKYIVFSTNQNKISGNIFIKSPYSTVYADYYNNELASFDSWGTTEFFKKINNDNYYKFSYENIGLTEKRSFYVTNNKNDNFDYFVYILSNLYYSYNQNKDMNNSIYINSGGTTITSNIETYYHNANINNLFEYLNENNNIPIVFSPIQTIWNTFHRGKIYKYFMIVIITSIIILLVKSMNKS